MVDVVLGKSDAGLVTLELARANRHGLIAGATGTGKTVSLQALAEQLAAAGCNVVVSDVKGDLAGMAMPGDGPEWVLARYKDVGVEYAPKAANVVLWDIAGKMGHPLRVTVSELGPLLLARLLDLSEVQEGVLQIVFQVADDEGLLLLDLKDLRALLTYVHDNAKALGATYGLISTASIAAIQRGLLAFEREGGADLFGEPAITVSDLLLRGPDGRGVVHMLHAVELMQQPRVYAMFLLYLLSELFEQLPEVGDVPVPKLAFFFDEAHLLFDNAPKALLEKVMQVVRLIRSKGVGVYFVTQQPSDVPDEVLAQLGNRVQHALRAATPQGQKAIKVAATTMAINPAFDTAGELPKLGVGWALVSVLDKKGIPQPVQKTAMLPPQSRVGVITDMERKQIIEQSMLRGRYESVFDRVSAFEMLQKRVAPDADAAVVEKTSTVKTEETGALSEFLWGTKRRQGVVETATKTVVRQVAGQLGREILRGLLGGVRR